MHSKLTSALIAIILLIASPALVFARDVTLAWDPNTESNLAGYRIYARETGDTYNYNYPEWQGTDAQCTLTGFDEYASYYFVVRAVDSEGNESGDSNEVYLASVTSSDSSSSDSSTLTNATSSDGGGGGGGCFIDSLFSR